MFYFSHSYYVLTICNFLFKNYNLLNYNILYQDTTGRELDTNKTLNNLDDFKLESK